MSLNNHSTWIFLRKSDDCLMRHLIIFDFIQIWIVLKHGIIKSIGTMKTVVSILNNQIIFTSNINWDLKDLILICLV